MSAGADTNRWSTPSAAAEVAGLAPLSDEARAILKPQHSPKAFVAALNDAFLGLEAMRIIPFALARREALWWAAQCVKAVPTLVQPPLCAAAIAAVEAWCGDPTDEKRRAALAAAEAAEMANPAACVAMAVFLCEGSLAPPNVAAVPPPPALSPGMAGNAVQMAAVKFFPEKAAEKYSIFSQLAEAVATGASRWPELKSRSTGVMPPANGQAAAPSAAPASSGAKGFPPYPQPKR